MTQNLSSCKSFIFHSDPVWLVQTPLPCGEHASMSLQLVCLTFENISKENNVQIRLITES